ncbi:MAG TPA: cytochrome c-type biogenesis protein CcmH [Candidatus Eisenbacteria bacterium]|nr:cytochrome c-type biogenesis protein CcmH [Candidatus Eisenbacteria bacterium]
MLRLVQIVLVALIVLSAAFALEEHTLTAEQMGRYDRLTHELIAPCCWREPIAIHRSQEALQMLDEVEKLVAEGRSEDEIRNIYVARYGPRILADPPGVSKYWLYLLPFSLLTWFMVAAVSRLRSLVKRAAPAHSSVPPELLAQVRKETESLF